MSKYTYGVIQMFPAFRGSFNKIREGIRLKKRVLGILLAFCLMVPFMAFAVPAQADGPGEQLYATGGDITVEILPKGGAYSSMLILFSPVYMEIGTTEEVGKTVTLTGIPAGAEMVFGIYVFNTGDTFKMGPADRNPDGRLHARVTTVAERVFDVGFEDLFGGGDNDFDDMNFRFSGALAPAPADEMPPVSTHTATPAPNMAGWNNTPVMVHLSAVDMAQDGVMPSGVEQIVAELDGSPVLCPGDACDFEVTGSGMHTVTHFARDLAGNAEAPHMFGLMVDLDAPVVTFAGNAGSYALDEMISITCSASDALSGIAADGCMNISGMAFTFGVGTHLYGAIAMDNAGNMGSGETSFTVGASFDSLCRLVEAWSTKDGVAHSLCVKLKNAAKANTPEARAGLIDAFVHEVAAQSGKAFTEEQAAMLTLLAGML